VHELRLRVDGAGSAEAGEVVKPYQRDRGLPLICAYLECLQCGATWQVRAQLKCEFTNAGEYSSAHNHVQPLEVPPGWRVELDHFARPSLRALCSPACVKAHDRRGKQWSD
jgi:hypothetical protein